MPGTSNFIEGSLEQQITTRYGILLSQTQLAELLVRTPGGLRYSLSYPSDQHTRDLKARGMLAYLLSRPDNWQVRVKDLS